MQLRGDVEAVSFIFVQRLVTWDKFVFKSPQLQKYKRYRQTKSLCFEDQRFAAQFPYLRYPV